MKRYFLILFLATQAHAFPIVSPASTSVFVNGTVQFTSTNTITWTLVSGSTGTISAGGLYTAPASFQSKNVIAGCPVVPNDHIYNVVITSLSVDTNSATRISNIGGVRIDMTEAAMPLNVITNATSSDTMKFYYTTSNDGKIFPIVPAPYRGIENTLYPAD